MRLPAPRLYRVPSVPQHPLGSQLATRGFACATGFVGARGFVRPKGFVGAKGLVCAKASDALAAKRTASTQVTDFFITSSLVGNRVGSEQRSEPGLTTDPAGTTSRLRPAAFGARQIAGKFRRERVV